MSFIRWRRWSWGLDARTLRRLSRSSLKPPIIPKRCKCKLTNHRCTMMPMRLVCFALISWFIKSIVANKKQIPPPDPKKWRHPIPPKTSWGDLSNIFSFPPRNGFLSLHPPPKRKKLFLNCTSNNNNYIKCDFLELEKTKPSDGFESGFWHPEKPQPPGAPTSQSRTCRPILGHSVPRSCRTSPRVQGWKSAGGWNVVYLVV